MFILLFIMQEGLRTSEILKRSYDIRHVVQCYIIMLVCIQFFFNTDSMEVVVLVVTVAVRLTSIFSRYFAMAKLRTKLGETSRCRLL